MLKLIFFLLLLLPLKQEQQQTWQLQSDDDGIRLYTATSQGEGKIKPIKVECTFNATPAQLLAVLMNIKNYTQWVYHTKSASIIKQAGPADLYYYSEVNVPWPGKNRDFVSHITVTEDPATKVITIDAPNVRGMVPQKENIERTTDSKGKWIITPDGNDRAKVIYYLQVDADGDAPAWLVNLFITDGPLDTFKKLRRQLQKAEYKK